ncbi:glycoside hydrolase/phage tail family protein [Rhizobiaceae bacterium n13]|uniref:baseplate multidomain protein megatron n=1 Tax=Ferirhizobium litorale TaxID=2927786 RepID=UPI0024B29803|nr:glycoside hydrolase/phage tail family protein [Fererhizobium litorale]MDI7861255.1 glycoside hydrolase/phage tail family protein [Fererhizobium litorale]
MATILFQAAGSALGGVFGPVGAIIGRAAGALAGSVVDRALINGSQTISGARLATARIPGADEGTAVNRVYGTLRIGGTLIWATRFEEEVTVERSGGKATGPRVESFRYFANFAIGLCEGPIAGIRGVWADGREIDLTKIEMRVYRGTASQPADPLIEAKQGTGRAPAYRGLAYVVFERLPLDGYGNRIPLMQFEVIRPVGRLEKQIQAVTIIPGASEHGYNPRRVTEKTGEGSARIINRHILTHETDWEASLDELTAVCPNLDAVALVVSWFGTDLRAGHCRIVPGVEVGKRDGESSPWAVSGISRAEAHRVSMSNGGPAYGGTPDDASVMAAITDLRARGLKVFLYPFLMMDIPAANDLPDPYGAARQAPYPWRGRITGHPATGEAGAADRTGAARTQVAAFAGTTERGDFDIDGTKVRHEGSDEGYRRLVLHYAHLAKAAGGVDGFVIGSELRGLTQLRDETGAFPFVSELVRLAADVRAILGPSTKLTYGADWSEYFGYHPSDGSDELHFNLDPLWASAAIDAVGIDNYMPLADWRDDDLSGEQPDGFRTADDRQRMMANIAAGEGFDWYYASDADRKARIRSPITDGLAGKPWVYRTKDIESWWANAHFERSGGAEHETPTAWVPRSKPVWFTELGCPAIDKGANQPNVFVDPKSAENAVPYFSGRGRDDSTQRRFLEAHHDWWSRADAPAGMVDPQRIFAWTWDARPFPAFPADLSVWSDGGNWRTGHWLNGRLGAGTLADVIAAILDDHGFADYDVSEVSGDLSGYAQGDVTSARSLIEPLVAAFQIDVIEDGGTLRFRSRARASLPARSIEVLADLDDEPLWQEHRGHDSDFASEAVVTYYNPALDYEQASVRSRRLTVGSDRVLRCDLKAALSEEAALSAAESLLRDHWISRRSLTFHLPPNDRATEPGDVLRLAGGPEGRFLVTRIEDGAARRIEARAFIASSGAVPLAGEAFRPGDNGASDAFAPVVRLMDLPRYETGEAADFARAAVMSKPWKRVLVSSSATTEDYRLRTMLERPARIGMLTGALAAGVSGRFQGAHTIEFDLPFGSLASASRLAVLNGENRLAVTADNGALEIIAFCTAIETAPNHWELSGLLRGLAGTEDAMQAGASSSSPVVVLDAAVRPLGLTAAESGLALNWMVEQAGGRAGEGERLAFAGGLRAETPLSPVHLKARRLPSGDIDIRWIRRGRVDADSWEATEVPLDEPEERYRVEILDGETIVRTSEVTAPTWTYLAVDEIADFGALQSQMRVRVRQIGRKVALGLPAMAEINL